ncbi:MerR family DNA-binding transcriptional regulator [Streptomyces sp. t39]|uniref:DNA polymerase III subunit beta family protein n=1 Tax=Streptomyces sp. t39 TaxID=1828156 RepID=UPI0011CEA227|nr:MerR family DNA-binding transcriptional regulator [Streptomyces sp. t39]TXS57895.1 MerR family DNA-binding transcriptional regulator [Streptomyces sp. t39]
MRSIGEMARDSGLSASALRFYDRAGVLVPAWVDPLSGYRWYEPGQLDEAKVLTRLRRAQMPLADIRLVLAGWSGADTELVRGLLDAHLRRLEQGLSDARTEFSTIREQLDDRENPMTSLGTSAPVRVTVPAGRLAAALDAVRFAVGADPELPVLGGVLLDIEGDALRVVATDRYRLAVGEAGTEGHGGDRVQALVGAPLVDAMRALLGGEETARLSLDGDRVTLETDGGQAGGQRLEHEFPDYRRLVQLPAGRTAVVDVAAFGEALRSGPVRDHEDSERRGVSYEVSVIAVDGGRVAVRGDGDEDEHRVGVNRAYLLDALAAGARDRLVLELGAPTAPVVIRRPDDEGTYSLLMPVRLAD